MGVRKRFQNGKRQAEGKRVDKGERQEDSLQKSPAYIESDLVFTEHMLCPGLWAGSFLCESHAVLNLGLWRPFFYFADKSLLQRP